MCTVGTEPGASGAFAFTAAVASSRRHAGRRPYLQLPTALLACKAGQAPFGRATRCRWARVTRLFVG